MNSTHLVGRLTKAPILTVTSSDKARVSFTLAVDGYNNTTDFLRVTCFGKLAENVAEYTDKGHLVSVEGRISSGKYTNDAGETVYTLDVIAARVGFISKPRNAITTPENVDPDNATDDTEAA